MGLVDMLGESPRALRFVDKATFNIFRLYEQYLDCKALETGLSREQVIEQYDPAFLAGERRASLFINADGAVSVKDPGRYLRASPKLSGLVANVAEEEEKYR